uniref:Protein kish-B n=1 Tax=Plectus sambesii TaxID=2011161 RepID=A0A914UKZ4_9BILA
MNAYSFDGLIVVALLLVCTCAYLKKVPRINSWLLSEKKGFFGIFYKAAVIGTRLHWAVSIVCAITALYARATLVDQAKTSMAVSRLINKKNEESVGNRANNAVGRDSVAAEKAKKASTSND